MALAAENCREQIENEEDPTMRKTLSLMMALTLLLTCITAVGAMAEDEKYTYTVLTYQAGVLDDDAYMVKYWNDHYGVNFVIDSLEQGSESELIPLRLADNTPPDILRWGRKNLMDLVEEGMYGTFGVETLKEYAPLVYEQMAAKEGLIEYYSIDGKLFTFGYIPLTSLYPSMGVWRQSWLDAIGAEMPLTLDEAESAWYAFAKEDPDGNGIDDTYGLSKGGMNQVYNAYGLYTTWIKGEDGQLVHRDVAPARREALERLARYYADGVLDPEFITGENNGGYWGVSHAFTNGRIGYTVHGNYSHWPLTYDTTTADSFANAGAIYQNFPDEVTSSSMPYVYAEPLEGPTGFKTYGGSAFDSSISCVGFSKDFINDEARFGRFLEIAQDLGGYNDPETYIYNRYGEKGVHWDYDEDGIPVSYPGYETVAERVAIGGLITFQFAMSDITNTILMSKADVRQIEACEALDYVTSPVYVTSTLPSESLYMTELNKLTSEVFMDIITGAKDITAFDEMVEQWYAMGGNVLTEEANELYNN